MAERENVRKQGEGLENLNLENQLHLSQTIVPIYSLSIFFARKDGNLQQCLLSSYQGPLPAQLVSSGQEAALGQGQPCPGYTATGHALVVHTEGSLVVVSQIYYTHKRENTHPLSETLPSPKQWGCKSIGQRETLISPDYFHFQSSSAPCTRNRDSQSTPALAQAHDLSLAVKSHVMEPRKLCFRI